MVGDDKRDIEAAIAAGCKPVFISQNTEETAPDNKVSVFSSLRDFSVSLFGQ
jgi:phosphoglycolate phosphatase-like HAD superfamily hydrolase